MEVEFSVEKFLKDVRTAQEKYHAVIVAVSEGIALDESELDDFQSGKSDNFGHKYLAGVGKALEKSLHASLAVRFAQSSLT